MGNIHTMFYIEKLYNNILKIDDVLCDIVGDKRCKGMNSSSHLTKLTLLLAFKTYFFEHLITF
jgi:hypothetical protein